jgi:DNA-binding PadR family transcriptional regulator
MHGYGDETGDWGGRRGRWSFGPPGPAWLGDAPFAWAGGPGGPHRGRRGRGRMRRGAIREAVLRVLADEPRHGYDVMNELAERSGGIWRPSPGSVYPTLQQLEDEGLVRATDVDGKRVFQLTDAGRAEAEKVKGHGSPWSTLDDGVSSDRRDLFQSAMQTGFAASQVAQAGSSEQIATARGVLDDTRKRLYRLLADDAG